MPKLLDELNRLQLELTDLDERERLLLRMCANLLETYYQVRKPQNQLTVEQYFKVPGRFEFVDGMLVDY